MKQEETIKRIGRKLSECSDLFEKIYRSNEDESANHHHFLCRELSAAKNQIEALSNSVSPSGIAVIRQTARLLRSSAEVLRELGWHFIAAEADVVASEATHLVNTANKEVEHANLQ